MVVLSSWSFTNKRWSAAKHDKFVCWRDYETQSLIFSGAVFSDWMQFALEPDSHCEEIHSGIAKRRRRYDDPAFLQQGCSKIGLDTIRSNNQSFADTAKRATAVGGNYRMEDIHETSTPEGKRVSFYYKNDKGTDSLKLVFDLSKEGTAWKIDNIGGSELGIAAAWKYPRRANHH